MVLLVWAAIHMLLSAINVHAKVLASASDVKPKSSLAKNIISPKSYWLDVAEGENSPTRYLLHVWALTTSFS